MCPIAHVFSVSFRDDPFYEPPLHKAFYHPTRQQQLSDDKKWVALSTERGRAPPDSCDVHFLQATHTLTPGGIEPGDISAPFDESWPTSEKPSILEAPGDVSDLGLSGLSGPMKPISSLVQEYGRLRSESSAGRPHPHMPDIGATSAIRREGDTTGASSDPPAAGRGESTLSKYIDRFRHGAPLSREQRAELKATTDPSDFWWLGSASPRASSTLRDTSESEVTHKVSTRSKGQRRPKVSSTSDSTRTTFSRGPTELDSETMRLLDKTDRLLERSESSLESSAPIVSTVGLGSDTSLTSSNPDAASSPATREVPYRPTFVNTDRDVRPDESRCPMRHEDDILYQWRQQRRMEMMRDKATRFLNAPTSSGPAPVDDVESKLAEFRRKVSTGTDRGIPPTARADHVALGMQAMKPGCQTDTSAKTDAVCQMRAISDAVCQTSPDTVNQIGPFDSPKKPETSSDHAPVTSALHSSPIASPSLSRRKTTTSSAPSREQQTTTPHFHLSCDIIPCPHDHLHHDTSAKKQTVKKPKGYHSDTDTDESHPRGHLVTDEEEPVKDTGPLVIDSCSDFEYETYKKRHMEELRSELGSGSEPTESQVAESQENGEARKPGPGENGVNKDSRGYKSQGTGRKLAGDRGKNKQSAVTQEESGKDSRKAGMDGGDSGRGCTTGLCANDQGHRSHRQSERSSSRERNRSQRGDKHLGRVSDDGASQLITSLADQTKRDERQVQVEDKVQRLTVQPKPKSGRQSPRMKEGGLGTRRSRDEAMRRSGGSLVDASINDHTPLCHSSPIRGQRAVTPTIQQVVTARLFDDTAVSADVPEEPEGVQDEPETTLNDSDAESDGEEFDDDDLLHELRARREHYRQRLDVVEQLLALTTHS